MRSGVKLNGIIPSKNRLNFFFYDPKYKQGSLPLYDRFPLVLPLETIPFNLII